VEKVYAFDPLIQIPPEQQSLVLDTPCHLWTE